MKYTLFILQRVGQKCLVNELQRLEFSVHIEDYIEQARIALFTLSRRSATKITAAKERLSNVEVADMHLTCGEPNINSREALRIYQ